MSITRRLLEKRASSATWGTSDVIPSNGSLGTSVAGVEVNDDAALRIIAVMSCVGILSDAVGTLPIDAIVKHGDRRQPVDPRPRLLEEPYQGLTAQDWLTQVMVSLLLRGNFYGVIVSRDGMFADQVMPLHPDQVQVGRDSSTGERTYKVNSQSVDRRDILHIPGLMLPGATKGLNPIQYARQGLGLTLATEAFGSQFFANGTTLSGVISTPYELTEEAAVIMARTFAAAHQGLGKSHLPAVITGGAQWTQLSVNPDDAQFLQTRDFQRSEIAMMFRIPPHMIGAVDKTTSWGTGIEQQEMGFVRNTLQGWTKRIESGLSALLPGDQVAKFNFAGRLRGDTLQRFQAYQIARQISLLNADECRAFEDLPPLPDGIGQDYLAPLNFAPVQDLGKQPEATPPSAETAPDGSIE